MIVVVKIGTSSVTSADGTVNVDAVEKLCREVSALRQGGGHEVVVVSSGAVTAGVATLWPGGERPTDPVTLQALASIGQHRLMRVYDDAFAVAGISAGQVLLTAADFGERRHYLHARATLERLLELGVVPVVNENDAVADDEICFGDNDRLAALVANLLGATLLVLLTDTAGLYDADPRQEKNASLVEEVTAIDAELERAAGSAGSPGGRGGMASKLAAARMASWSGVRVVIADARRPEIIADAVAGVSGVGTIVMPSPDRLTARKLWIAFALPARGRVIVDEGARRALIEREASLLPAGVVAVSGSFVPGDAVEIGDEAGEVFAKGITQLPSDGASTWMQKRIAELPQALARELIERDDLVVLVSASSSSR